MMKKFMVITLSFAFILTGFSPLMAQTKKEIKKEMSQERKGYRQQPTSEEKEKIKNSAQTAIDIIKNLTDEQKNQIKIQRRKL